MLVDDLIINERKVGDVMVIELEGDLDGFTVQKLRSFLNGMAGKGINKIVLNLSKLRYINSISIRQIREFDGNIALAELNDRVNRIIALVGGRKVFRIFDSEEDAIKELTEKGESGGKTEDN